jgi:hypothetical protein
MKINKKHYSEMTFQVQFEKTGTELKDPFQLKIRLQSRLCAGFVRQKRRKKVQSFIEQKVASSSIFCCPTNPAKGPFPLHQSVLLYSLNRSILSAWLRIRQQLDLTFITFPPYTVKPPFVWWNIALYTLKTNVATYFVNIADILVKTFPVGTSTWIRNI